MLEHDEFGLLQTPPSRAAVTPADRLAAGFEEIVEFVRLNSREPTRSVNDISEAKLAMRLDGIRQSEAQAALLRDFDPFGLLGPAPSPPAEVAIPTEVPQTTAQARDSDPFDLLARSDDLFELKSVPKPQTPPERVARRQPAKDFAQFGELFSRCHADLRSGTRKLLPFKNPMEIETGKFFVLNGVLVYVAAMGELEYNDIQKANTRTRCIFENGTESDLLLQSLASSLYKDGRRVTEPDDFTLARMGLDPETKMARVYVLRSESKDPQLASIQDPHKIGFTTQTVLDRIAGAHRNATFLGAPVQTVAAYAVPAVAAREVESLLHNFFAPRRLDVWFEREGNVVAGATEWFDVPLAVIDEAINLISAETIANYEYDPEARCIRLKASQD